MARRRYALTGAAVAAAAAALGLALLIVVAVAALAAAPRHGPVFAGLDARLARVVAFSLMQAGLSTALAVVPGIVVARALARRRFPGRTAVLRLFGLPLVVPVVVAVFGLIAVWGRAGWANAALAALGLPALPAIYGLPGILIAHVFFNLPLAVRLLLTAWAAIPTENWRLAGELGLSSAQVFRFVEWPALRNALPCVAAVVFFLCFTSFAVVLTLGGGPRATTVEVAIFQALRLDFDVGRAVTLAAVQLGLCLAIASLLFAARRSVPIDPGLERPWPRPDTGSGLGRAVDGLAIAVALAVVGLPVAAMVARGVTGPVARVLADAGLWAALARSLAVGLLGGAIATGLGVVMALGARDLRTARPGLAAAIERTGAATLVVSPLVLGSGLFVLAQPIGAPAFVGLGLVVVLGAVFALPYAVHLASARLAHHALAHDRLCAAFGIAGWNRFRLIDVPALRRPAGLALALGAALGAGDLGAIALFGDQNTETLALRLYRQIAGYRLDEAAVTALVHVVVVVVLFVVIERWVGGRDRG